MHLKKGFTLVEVIVVSVIVAVLAAVAVPLYMGYLNDTRQESVDQLAQTAAAAANDLYRKTGSDPGVADLNLFYDHAKFTVNINAGSVTVTLTAMSQFTHTVAYR
jgi:prepilin-type N-terminal cleavage/methylation domain-containing protein